MLPMNRPPTTPGEMLLEEFLKPRGIQSGRPGRADGRTGAAREHHRERQARHHRRDRHPPVRGSRHYPGVLDGGAGRPRPVARDPKAGRGKGSDWPCQPAYSACDILRDRPKPIGLKALRVRGPFNRVQIVPISESHPLLSGRLTSTRRDHERPAPQRFRNNDARQPAPC